MLYNIPGYQLLSFICHVPFPSDEIPVGTIHLLVFIDDVTAEEAGRVLKCILSAEIQHKCKKLIGWHFIVQNNNDPIIQKQPKVFSRPRNGIFFGGQINHLISTEKKEAFQLQKKSSKTRRNYRQLQSNK